MTFYYANLYFQSDPEGPHSYEWGNKGPRSISLISKLFFSMQKTEARTCSGTGPYQPPGYGFATITNNVYQATCDNAVNMKSD